MVSACILYGVYRHLPAGAGRPRALGGRFLRRQIDRRPCVCRREPRRPILLLHRGHGAGTVRGWFGHAKNTSRMWNCKFRNFKLCAQLGCTVVLVASASALKWCQELCAMVLPSEHTDPDLPLPLMSEQPADKSLAGHFRIRLGASGQGQVYYSAKKRRA